VHIPLLRAFALVLLLPILACRDTPDRQVESEPGAAAESAPPPDPVPDASRADVEARGGAAAGALAQGLVSRLTAAMAEGGVAGAVDFCSIEALALTSEIAGEHDASLEVKRTSARWRNPENAPDPHEERVLAYLESLEETERGTAPETLTAMGPDGSYRFYRTLRTAPMCLSCHGDEENLDVEVRRLLEERYPDDRATGYTEGEFRGVIRVQMPASAGSNP
jgi:hypothetical protein